MATLAAIAGLAAGGISAYGQYQSGQQAEQAYNYNAQIARQEADLIKKGADLDEFRSRKQLRQVVGSQVAGYAASGVEFTGSPLDVIADTIANAELEIAISKFNAEMGARGKISEAGQMKRQGKQARTASQIQAASTLLATAGDYGSKYYVPKKTKIGE